jgi:DNA modification methylase
MLGQYRVCKSLGEIGSVVHSVVTSPPYFQQRQYGDSSEEIGKESTISEYCEHLVDIFNAIPLHPKGSVWVNLGDKRGKDTGLLNVPERFALAMCDDGWLLMDKVIWAKVVDLDNGETIGHCMIEPADNRLNGNGFEFLYRFSRSREAWVDPCAVSLPRQNTGLSRYLPEDLMSVTTSVDGRRLHNVWQVEMGQSRASHFAVFDPALISRPIAMSCPMKVCSKCGHLETRIVEMEEYDEGRRSRRLMGKYRSVKDVSEKEVAENFKASGRQDTGKKYTARKPVTKGWSSCKCKQWQPGVVLDPFCGSGTTGEVALKLGRSFIGVDIYDKYLDMTKRRCKETIKYLENSWGMLLDNRDPWSLRQ